MNAKLFARMCIFVLLTAVVCPASFARKSSDLFCCISKKLADLQEQLPDAKTPELFENLMDLERIVNEELGCLEKTITITADIDFDFLCEKFEGTFSTIRDITTTVQEQFDITCTKLLDEFETTNSCLQEIKELLGCENKIPVTQDGPFDLDQAGATYCLAEDVGAVINPQRIDITADNVTFDLNNHTLTGGISALGSSNAHIFGGTVREGQSSPFGPIGIDLGDSTIVEDVTIHDCGNGIFSGNTSNCFVRNCFIHSGTGFQPRGIIDQPGSTNNCYINCVIKDSNQGILMSGHDNLILDCVTNNNTFNGILLNGDSHDNLVRNCTANNNGGFGIRNDGTNNNVFDNIALNNTSGAYNTNRNSNSATPITGPTTITLPGSYIVVNDIESFEEPAITINASNVILDLNKHRVAAIGMEGAQISILVNPDLSNVEIFNGTFAQTNGGELGGVFLKGGNGHYLHDLTLIHGLTPYGNIIEGSNHLIERCRVLGGGTGFFLDCQNCCLKECVTKNMEGNGIQTSLDSSGNIILNCIANDNDGKGIIIDGTNNYVSDCIADHNEFAGIEFVGTGSLVFGNEAANNGASADDNFIGVLLDVMPTTSVGRLENVSG